MCYSDVFAEVYPSIIKGLWPEVGRISSSASVVVQIDIFNCGFWSSELGFKVAVVEMTHIA